ncbi:MAG: ubiquinol-cytochrome c reductase iron-sulfur subunit [Acidobacteria bacterium]|nr:ubiquinol-cytochrome c reductase iron-sulfur subunit [Acidobacteriota bacterium]MCI0724718.1 ubiquinol-cytochrome c reductase iron-sulfur subunit [Acidobacteriota bacterium]
MNRRTFYLTFIYAVWALIGFVLGIPAAIYLLWPPRPKKEAGWIEAGSLAQVKLRTPDEFVFRRNRVDGWKVTSEKSTAWVVKMAENQVVAFSPQCPHLGCAYHWVAKQNEFLCPCHASTFSIEGEVLTGPAPRALDRFEVKMEGDKLLLGPVRQSREAGS